MNGSRNRTAGHSFERECVKLFKQLGFTHVETSRLVSKMRDSQKIDLANPDELEHGRFPYNVQCKNTTTLNYSKILQEVPITPGIKNVVLHKHTKKVGTKFISQGKFAYMYMENFFELVEELEKYKKGYEAMMEYFDSIPEDEKPKLDLKLKTLGL
jgi:hypothetical protein